MKWKVDDIFKPGGTALIYNLTSLHAIILRVGIFFSHEFVHARSEFQSIRRNHHDKRIITRFRMAWTAISTNRC
ncbi:hypothetical protein GCM10017717_11450 [Deinococcus persicinus]